MNGVVLAGTSSGVGKTVATLAVLRALEREGLTPQPMKAGPDFIDPSHHDAVLGIDPGDEAPTPSRTLDPWLQGEDGLRRNYRRGDGDVAVVEGVMGLYDGSVASTADAAAALDLPVVLVVDGKAGMQSVGATVLGFREYAAEAGVDVDVAGAVLQRTHGGRHAEGIRESLPDGVAYCGRIPPDDDLQIPDRHLGLHMGDEATPPREALDAAAETVRVDRLLDLAREPPMAAPRDAGAANGRVTDGPRVAVARDRAFRFVYPATIERLRERGEVVPFAPAEGEDLPDCDGVYLPGGYPELYARELSESPALSTLSDRASEGVPVLGECGGMMALAESLTTTADAGPVAGDGDGPAPDGDADGDGETHAMAGVLPAAVELCDRYRALDHVELEAREPTLTADAGQRLRGHEFHYSTADVARDATFAFDVQRGEGIDGDHDGLTEYRTLGTYAHVHAGSGAFDRFLASL